MGEQLFSAEEAAQILGLQVRTVRGYVRDGRLPGVRIGKQYRIARADLDAFTAGGVPGTPAAPASAAPAARGPVHRGPEVSSVVQIEDVEESSCARLERTLAAAVLARAGDAPELRVEPLYDEARRRLKVIIVGSVEATAELLRIVELFAREG